MTTQRPDEKLCPYCAETIKAAAVKCRYCHSDLTEAPAAAPAADGSRAQGSRGFGRLSLAGRPSATAVADVPPPPDAVDEADDRAEAEPGLLASFRLMRILVGVCLVLALVTAAAWWFDRHQSQGYAQGPITSVQARDAGIAAATRLTEKVLSYDSKNLDADTKAAEAVMAPSFRAQYAKAMSRVHDQTLKNKVRLQAKAVATSIVSASEHKVVALVFVNQVTSAAGAQNERLDQNRVRVTLTRGGGEWRVSGMDAF